MSLLFSITNFKVSLLGISYLWFNTSVHKVDIFLEKWSSEIESIYTFFCSATNFFHWHKKVDFLVSDEWVRGGVGSE